LIGPGPDFHACAQAPSLRSGLSLISVQQAPKLARVEKPSLL